MVRFTPLLLTIAFAGFCSGSTAGASTAPGFAAEIPFELRDGFIVLEGRVEGHPGKLNVLLDSGASVSVLSARTARRLQVRTGKNLPVRGVGCVATAREIEPLPARANGVNLAAFSVVSDLRAADQFCSVPVDGLIGIQFFEDRVVEIDFATRLLRILPAPDRCPGAVRLPLRIRNGVACVSASVNGCQPRWVRLDTGCNEALHWVIPRRVAGQSQDHGSIGFISTASDRARVPVEIGPLFFPRTDTVLHVRELFPAESGLLGLGLLSKFRSVTVDWPARALLLRD